MSDKPNLFSVDTADLPAPSRKFVRGDGWSNVLSGLGGTRDKRTGASYTNTTLIDTKAAIELYDGDGLIKSIIDILPDDVYMSQIVDWTAKTKEHDDAPDSAACLMRARFSKKGSNSERWRW